MNATETTRLYATFFGGKLHPKQVQIGVMANGAKIYGEPDDPRAANHEAELEAKGEQARRECRSRSPFMAKSDLVAFQRGWDREQELRRICGC